VRPPPATTSRPALPFFRAVTSALNATALIPLFYCAVLFLTGIASSRALYLRPSLLLTALLPLSLAAIFAIVKAPRLAWLPIAFVWLILGLWSAETEPQAAPSPAITALTDGLLRTIDGTVISAEPLRAPPLQSQSDDNDPTAEPTDSNAPPQTGELSQRVDLRITAAEFVTDQSDAMASVTDPAALLRLTIRFPAGQLPPAIRCGQPLRAVFRTLPAETYHDPGVWDRAEWLEAQSIAATASFRARPASPISAAPLTLASGSLVLLSQPTGFSFACQLASAQQTAVDRLESLPSQPALTHLSRWLRVSPDDAAMLAALIAGDRTFLTRTLRTGFERTGSFHLIVVSGLHIAILAGCVLGLTSRMRIPRLPATLATISITLGYALFTGFAVPVQRSFWMISLYLLGRLVYRSRNPLNLIGFAALCLLAADPRSLFDAGFQMTLLSVGSIAGVALPLLDRSTRPWREAARNLTLIPLDVALPPSLAQFRVTLRMIAVHLEPLVSRRIARTVPPLAVRAALRLVELVFVALVVECALALPMALYFHRITVYALPVNLLILPLLAVLVPAAMILLLTLSVWPAAAALPATLCVLILHIGVAIVRILGRVSLADFRIPAPGPLQATLAAAFILLAIQLARGRRIQRRLAFAATILAAIVALWPRAVDHPANALLFEAIDVGQGDALLLITPDGKTLLIDAGGLLSYARDARNSQTSAPFDIGEEVVSPALWSRGIRRLDAVALTHAHADHMGGMAAILRNFRPRELWVGNNPPIPAYTALLQQAKEQGVTIRSLRIGDSPRLGSATVSVLAPAANYRPSRQPANDDSLVLEAGFGATRILLAGDAEAPEENAMLSDSLASPDSLSSAVLKVGHHGSLTSTRPAFLAPVAPFWAVISCGRRNRFGHPRPEILAELQSAHVRTYRTDLDGALCLLLNGQSVTAQPMCRTGP
jgi:competence protein ComEC